MCGFTGVVGKVETTELRAMAEAVAHRGPDGQGEYLSPQFSAIHHRLAIIGPDARGTQPMCIDDVVVLFNGCIYNYRELKAQLEQDGVRFESDTDTEVIPHLYRRFGLGMFNLLQGMFAIALWDAREQFCLIARDPFGEKPLFVCEQSGRIGFSSSQNAFEKGNWSLTPDLNAVYSILTRMRAEAPQTMYQEVNQLPAGCYAIARAGTPVQIRRYFFLPEPDQPQDLLPHEIEPEVERMLEYSIMAQTMADKPLGVFLSGGVDSSLIAAMLRKQKQQVHSFSVRFRGAPIDYDESRFAQKVASHLQTEHKVLEVDAGALKTLDEVAASFDLPVTNAAALPTYLISKAAKPYVDVALSGVGGDELFGGYPRYLGMHWHGRLQQLPGRNVLLNLLQLLPEGDSSFNQIGRAKRLLQGLNMDADEAYLSWMKTTHRHPHKMFNLFPVEVARPWQSPIAMEGGISALIQRYGAVNGAMIHDVLTYLSDDLLAMGDRMSMASALELRAPFLNPALFTFLATLDSQLKVKGLPWQGQLKVILKSIAGKYLPHDVIDRPKQGFMAPVKHWLRHDYADEVQRMIAEKPLAGLIKPAFVKEQWQRHQRGEDRSDILWGMLLLHRWMQQHGWQF